MISVSVPLERDLSVPGSFERQRRENLGSRLKGELLTRSSATQIATPNNNGVILKNNTRQTTGNLGLNLRGSPKYGLLTFGFCIRTILTIHLNLNIVPSTNYDLKRPL